MIYRIEFLPSAEQELAALDRPVRERVSRQIASLATNPRPAGIKMLKGRKGFLRLRVGDYRVIYQVEDDRLVVLAVKIGHRRDVYDR